MVRHMAVNVRELKFALAITQYHFLNSKRFCDVFYFYRTSIIFSVFFAQISECKVM